MIKKFVIQLLCLSIYFLSQAQETSPFPYLDKIDINHYKGCELHLDATKAKIYNVKRIALDKSNQFYAEECEGEYETLIATYTLDKKYTITYGTCPNPEFKIYDSRNINQSIIAINASKMYITPSGVIYCSGGQGTFNTKKKFKIIDNKIQEIKQPFYHVGLSSKTLKPIVLYQTINLKKQVAKLPTNYDVEIVLSKEPFNATKGMYLVKTKFGLIGWAELEADQYHDIDIQGLQYNGD